jgi:low affinity Fe/Cu permease
MADDTSSTRGTDDVPQNQNDGLSARFSRLASRTAALAGNYRTFAVMLGIVLVWAISGPIFNFSTTWQLVINTGTTIVTFLMVFLIQRSQNKDSRAVHLKLNELVSAMEGASNRLIDVEDLSEDELRALHGYYCSLVELSRRDASLTKSHSVEEAAASHEEKHGKPEIGNRKPR